MEFSGNKLFETIDPLLAAMPSSLKNSTATRTNLSPRTKLILEVLMVLMSVGAVTGNILVIVIVAATKTFHSVTSVLIINLAISDFLVGIGVMPFVAVSIMNNRWVSYTDLCLYVGYTSSVYCTASVLTLAAIALDRYYSIMDCLRYNSRCTVWRTGAAVLWIWLQAMVTSCPPLLGWSSVSFVGPMYSCSVNWASSPSYTAFMAALTFLLPATVILFCYVKIVRVARSHARRIHSLEEHIQRTRVDPIASPPSPVSDTHAPSRLVYYLSGRFVSEAPIAEPNAGPALSDPSDPQLHGENTSDQPPPTGRRLHSFFGHLHSSGNPQQAPHPHHGVVRLFMVIAAFFVCWTPYISVALVQATETALSRATSQVPSSAVTFSYWLVLFNSDINPLLYALLSKRFQGALQSLRQKIQARLGSVVGRGSEGRLQEKGGGSSNPNSNPTVPLPVHQSDNNGVAQEASSYSSVLSLNPPFHSGYKEQLRDVLLPGSATSAPSCPFFHACGETGPKRLECLQVPSQPQEGGRLPFSAATNERQATFFYGHITVRVEHDC